MNYANIKYRDIGCEFLPIGKAPGFGLKAILAKALHPEKSIWCYTGDIYEDLADAASPRHTDETDEPFLLKTLMVTSNGCCTLLRLSTAPLRQSYAFHSYR